MLYLQIGTRKGWIQQGGAALLVLKSKGGAVSGGFFRHLHLRFGFEFQKYLLRSRQLVTALKKKSRQLWVRCTQTF